MAAINDLINQIQDPALRDRIQKEVNKLSKQKKFGLVFEEHMPECTPLYDMPIKAGTTVAKRTGSVNDTYKVLRIEDGVAVCLHKESQETCDINVADLLAVAEFGESIYPYLKPIDSVCNAPDSDLWHTLIESDNYHALQLLEYLYAGKVDCIYIDPPYNTGAKDWKYNNDYVDGNDTYRHSKWLSFIEDILFGSEQFTEQQDAIFVWLSDSPQLNEQSKQKIELKADRIRLDQCVVISDETFDMEVLEDGHIYFLNTQKLGKAGNLSRRSDTRQYTIWETIENTARTKADRLYFIIDEAHRGMQGRQAGTATTIMQRFIKGSPEHNLSPIPVVIGMSATSERFDALIGKGTTSSLHKVIVSPAQVRQSGLLKDRIVITYPDDPTKHSDMAVLQAATDEWQDKCKHWYQYTYEQHYTNVNPVFVIQVCAGSGKNISDTNLDDVIAKIEERIGETFKEHEVVHTFGSTGTLSIHGLNVHHVEPAEIAEDRRIKVVL